MNRKERRAAASTRRKFNRPKVCRPVVRDVTFLASGPLSVADVDELGPLDTEAAGFLFQSMIRYLIESDPDAEILDDIENFLVCSALDGTRIFKGAAPNFAGKVPQTIDRLLMLVNSRFDVIADREGYA